MHSFCLGIAQSGLGIQDVGAFREVYKLILVGSMFCFGPPGPRAYPRPSNVVPFWVWYDFLVRILVKTTKKVRRI